MISPNQCRRFAFLTCLLALLAGCADKHDEAEVQLPDWLSETGSVTTAATSEAADDPAATPRPVRTDQSPSFARSARTSGAAQLQPGDQFPLRKVVEQELTQPSLNGDPQISRSRMELLLTITLADVRDGHTLMQVHYDRVHYSHDVAGERVEYDSAQPSQNIPSAVLAYHGMVGDGFAFWLGPDNQIAQVVGFREFVDRCMTHVPVQQRQQALLAVEASAGQQGVADFVDSTIGLLPREGEQLSAGRWADTQHITQPVPMQINTVYTLTDMNDSTAEVMIGGTIVSSTALGASDPQNSRQVQITVNGGSTTGHCTIDRHSGLPRQSQLERVVDMTVQMDGGIEFAQQKRTLTTVEALPQQRLAAHEGRPLFR
jgi:hypothetical protein